MATSCRDTAWINRPQQDVSAYIQRVTRGGPNENWDSQSTVCACKSAQGQGVGVNTSRSEVEVQLERTACF